jgi:hypothetical protein
MNIGNLTSLQQFVEKIPLYAQRPRGWAVAGFLNKSHIPRTDYYSLKLKDYEEDHFGTLSPVRYYIDVRVGSRDG